MSQRKNIYITHNKQKLLSKSSITNTPPTEYFVLILMQINLT